MSVQGRLSVKEDIDRWIQALVAEFTNPPPKTSLMECPSAAVLQSVSAAEHLQVLKAACLILEQSSNFFERSCLKRVVAFCLEQVPKFSDEQKWELINLAADCSRSGFSEGSISAVLGAQLLVAHTEKSGVTDEAVRIARIFLPHLWGAGKIYDKVDSILMSKDKKYAFNKLIDPTGKWSIVAREDISSLCQESQDIWLKILEHATSCSGSKPSKKWLDKSNLLLQQIGRETFESSIYKWFPLVAEGAQANLDLLKGLVWMTTLIPSQEMTQLLGVMAEACFKKVPGQGAMAPKVANACVAAMGALSSSDAIVQLGKLQAKARKPSAKDQIEKALQGAADKTGMSVDEMQELNVPGCGFTEVGRYVLQLGEYQAVLLIADAATVELSFIAANGKTVASIPAAIKTAFPAEIKALKSSKQEVEKLLPALRYRIEHSLINQRHWNFAAWRERYHDHPIAGAIARKLIWTFNGKPALWREGKFRDLSGNVVETEDATLVELWHPIAAEAATVKAWRKLLQELKITQPFKQAHREIYVLTDAERQTGTYSNRFAAHIILQQQFAALCHQRGWRFSVQGGWDQELSVPVLKLPRWNLNAEFWVDRVEAEMNDMGILLYLSTDQVRFCRPDSEDAIPLNEILPVVFSEVMRDVDLFVGVASIGNDPEWIDHTEAEGRTHREYWYDSAFGSLSPSSETRKQVLEEIIPSLQIAERCSFADKFLVVRGDIRSYKIHLGSGNILMEPNDQYLCIVPARSSASSSGKIYLPFEGDRLLSMILSKALLLAEDTKISDASIMSQIRRQ